MISILVSQEKGRRGFEESIDALLQDRENRKLLPGVKLPPQVQLTANDAECFAGTTLILLNPVGETRLPNYGNLDFHVDRPVKIGTVKFMPTLDLFNVMNNNVIQGVRTTQNATNANQVQAITAPRVVRFGIRVNW